MTSDHSAPRGWPRSRPFEGSGWLTVAQARNEPGLRITDSPYWGAWWAQALRAILHVKKIPYRKVVHPPFSDTDPHAQDELFAWTAQTSVPTMVYNDGSVLGDVVRNDWLNQLMLAEQLAPSPALLPADPALRMRVVGLSHELMSPQGFMWNARLAMSHLYAQTDMTSKQRDFFGSKKFLGGKYAHNGKDASPLENARAFVSLLGMTLAENNARHGGPYLVGDALTVADIYWAYASNFVELLPPEQLPVMRFNRAMYPDINAALTSDVTPTLIQHRDTMFARHLESPVVVD